MDSARPLRVTGIALCAVILVSALLTLSCTFIDTVTELITKEKPKDDPMPLDVALLVTPEDQRAGVLETMGAPDAFSIRFDELEGKAVRWETWSYFDYGHAMDFVDGELLWTVELDPIPDGSLYAHFYTPDSFRAHMSPDQVRDLLAWQSLEEIDLTEGDIPGGLILAGDQILLGFDQDRLVYVETLVLTPDDAAPVVVPDSAAAEPVSEPASAVMAAGSTSVRALDGMTMVYVPAGAFVMGGAQGWQDERPVHDVTLDAFRIDRTEVTQQQYLACVTAGECAPSEFADDRDYGAPEQPVVGVTWFDAVDYCRWVGGRLPTEAEWEYAARGPGGTIYPWGNDLREGVANCEEDTCRDGYEVAAPVGSFPAGASWVGALDMAGNVWEWVADWAEAYPSTPVTNPTGPSTGEGRVLRGGDWDNDEDYMRSSNRDWEEPTASYYTTGFRCASAERP